jgi:hypothetical protein
MIYVVLGLIGWFIVLGLVQQGLHQVRDEQLAHTKAALEEVKAAPLPVSAQLPSPAVN